MFSFRKNTRIVFAKNSNCKKIEFAKTRIRKNSNSQKVEFAKKTRIGKNSNSQKLEFAKTRIPKKSNCNSKHKFFIIWPFQIEIFGRNIKTLVENQKKFDHFLCNSDLDTLGRMATVWGFHLWNSETIKINLPDSGLRKSKKSGIGRIFVLYWLKGLKLFVKRDIIQPHNFQTYIIPGYYTEYDIILNYQMIVNHGIF